MAELLEGSRFGGWCDDGEVKHGGNPGEHKRAGSTRRWGEGPGWSDPAWTAAVMAGRGSPPPGEESCTPWAAGRRFGCCGPGSAPELGA